MTNKTVARQVQIVFLIDTQKPYRPIVNTAANIVVLKKMTWAEVPDFKTNKMRRYLLGSSAFFTLAAAQTSKLGRLRKLERALGFLRWQAPYVAQHVKKAMDDYRATGTIQ